MPDSNSPLPYYRTHQFKANVAGRTFHYITKPGIPHWDEISPTTILLSEFAALDPDQEALLIGCGHGALAVVLSSQLQQGRLWVYDSSYIAQSMTALTLSINELLPVKLVSRLPLPEKPEYFHTVLIDLPKGRKLARRRLIEAYQLLSVGGKLYLAGANQEGIQPVIKDAEGLFGPASILGYKKGCRVACLKKEKHVDEFPGWVSEPGLAGPYFENQPGITAFGWHEFEALVHRTRLCLRTTPGVFSFDGLDGGTRLLLENLPPVDGGRVLDFGCGCGVIGLFAARWGAEWVDMIDVNLESVAASCENGSLNQVQNMSAFPSDVLSQVADREYDFILSNPPFHVGKEVDYDIARTFIQHARHVLKPGGRLVLVSNRFIRYDRVMQEVFQQVSVLFQDGKFHVLAAYK